MEAIRSPEQYSMLVSGFRKTGYRLSNCFFLPETIRQKTSANTLSCLQMNHGALILDDQGSFYRCYYFLPEADDPDPVFLDKDAVIELPFNDTMNEKQRLQEQKIMLLGFHPGRRSGMMAASPDTITRGRADGQTVVDVALPADQQQILMLLYDSFNPLYAFLPTADELRKSISASEALVIRTEGTVKAVLLSSFQNGIASIRQVAVQEAARGRGFGRSLVEIYHRRYLSLGAKEFRHWVDLDNQAAMNMYHSFGYQPDRRKANEYISLKGDRR